MEFGNLKAIFSGVCCSHQKLTEHIISMEAIVAKLLNHAVTVFPLSQSQKNVWDLEQSYPGTSINHIATTVRISGQVDLTALQKTIQLIIEADSSLRIRIGLQNNQPVQYYVPYEPERFDVFDFSLSGEEGISRWEEASAKDVMDCVDKPLYRFWIFHAGENEGGVLFKLHHLISDGWSQVMLCNKIQKTYLELLAGKESTLEKTPEYIFHVQEEENYLSSRQCEKDQEFWKRVLAKNGDAATIRHRKGASLSPVGDRISFLFPKSISYKMFSYCEEHRVAPFAVYYMALAIYFKKAFRLDHPIIGVPVVNRGNFTAKQTTGMFVSTLPFFCEIDEELSFHQMADVFIEHWYELLRHQKLPFSAIKHLAQQSGTYDGRLFHIALSYLDNQVFTQNSEGNVIFTGRWHYSGFQAEQLCIHLSNLSGGRQFTAEYDYLTQLFSEREIQGLHECLVQILEEVLEYPDRPIGRISLLSKNHREKILYDFNQTEQAFQHMNLTHQLQQAFYEDPDRAVTIYEGDRFTYRALREKAGQIAYALKQVGLYDSEIEDPLVALFLPYDPSLFFGIGGALWAGIPYVLLSSELPGGRIREILEQSGTQVLITSSPPRLKLGVGIFKFNACIVGRELPVNR